MSVCTTELSTELATATEAPNQLASAGSYPHLLTSASEPVRAACELAAFGASLPLLLATAPQGDGHSVLTLPGFTASDLSTLPLRRFLNRLGYNARPWQLGRNTGSPELIDRLARRFHRLALKSDEPITLIGHSLGGVFARELARQYPDHVRQVITLGSPFALTATSRANPLVMRLFNRSAKMSPVEIDARAREQLAAPPPVPTTAIYSRLDGVVHWRTCREQPSAQTENIEVPGSHIGMTVHPTILYILADRVAQQKASWEKFRQPGSWRDMLFSPGSTVQ